MQLSYHHWSYSIKHFSRIRLQIAYGRAPVSVKCKNTSANLQWSHFFPIRINARMKRAASGIGIKKFSFAPLQTKNPRPFLSHLGVCSLRIAVLQRESGQFRADVTLFLSAVPLFTWRVPRLLLMRRLRTSSNNKPNVLLHQPGRVRQLSACICYAPHTLDSASTCTWRLFSSKNAMVSPWSCLVINGGECMLVKLQPRETKRGILIDLSLVLLCFLSLFRKTRFTPGPIGSV